VTAAESAESVAAEMGPWTIARENGLAARASISDIAAEWAAELEPTDDEARQEAEDGALAGFDRYLAGVKA
jgi:hypothetical protein